MAWFMEYYRQNRRVINRFLTIGLGLGVLSILLIKYFTHTLGYTAHKANVAQTLILYPLQYFLNWWLTWGHVKATAPQEGIRIIKVVFAKVVTWSLDQGVYGFWYWAIGLFLVTDLNFQFANILRMGTMMVGNFFYYRYVVFIEKQTKEVSP